jgi:signal transduction histidine kinase
MMSSLLKNWRERRTTLLMRLTLFSVLFLFVGYAENTGHAPWALAGLPILFLGLAAAQFLAPERLFRSDRFQAGVFLAEIALLSLLIFLTQGFSGDLYLLYFLTILMAGFTRQVWQVAATAGAASLLYGLILWTSPVGHDVAQEALLLRIPFLILVSVFVSLYALSARRRAVRLMTAEKEIAFMRDKLTEAERLSVMGEVLAGVVHEVNNPLTSILGYSDLELRDSASALPPATREALEIILEQARRAKRILEDISVFSRQEPTTKRPADVNAVLREALRLESYPLRMKKIDIDTDLEENLPSVLADDRRLLQVFLNLFINAQHAMADHRGEGRLTVRSRLEGGRLRIEIEDDGPGIPEHVLPRIFEPFFTTKAPGKGTGLGLSLSYGIIQDHGGSIRAENTPEGGARFIVDLPMDEQLPVETAAPGRTIRPPLAAPQETLA